MGGGDNFSSNLEEVMEVYGEENYGWEGGHGIWEVQQRLLARQHSRYFSALLLAASARHYLAWEASWNYDIGRNL